MQHIRKVIREFLSDAGIMHERWYREAYGVKARGRDGLIDHFVKQGLDAGYSPHPLFDPEWYLAANPDVAEHGMAAADHYFSSGAAEGRIPSPFFDPQVTPVLMASRRLTDLRGGLLAGFVAGEDLAACLQFIDPDTYDPSVKTRRFHQLVDHFFVDGLRSGAAPHPLLATWPGHDQGGLLARYRSFRALFLPDADDSVTHPLIQAPFYRTQTEGLACHPTVHYLRTWRERKIWTHPLLDPEYRSKKGSAANSLDPVRAYLNDQAEADADPNSYFDAAAYRQAYGHRFQPDDTPLSHYMRNGHLPEFEPSERFGQKYYVRRASAKLRDGWPALADFLHSRKQSGPMGQPPVPFLDPAAGHTDEELAALIADEAKPSGGSPLVTVIVPTYQNVTDTLRCIYALVTAPDATPFITHVVDDASPDRAGDTLRRLLDDVASIKVVQNTDNLGFLRSVNAAVADVETPYIYLLNNDTFVLPGFLDRLIETFERYDRVGAAGGKLLFPTGMLQEAGGVVFEDGSAANFGRQDDPAAPQYNYLREVDYISAAALLVRTETWVQVGGFSDQYAPAYYEDTDFGMKLRAAGQRMLYQPSSRVVHIEGVTCGNDLSSGIKRYQEINREAFAATWKDQLTDYGRPGDLSRSITDRYTKGRILVIDAELPRPDSDSGSVTAFHVLTILSDMGYRVTFMPSNLQYWGQYAAPLIQHGIEVLRSPHVSSGLEYLREKGDGFDAFWLSRAPTADEYFQNIRSMYPDTPLIFDTVDIHHLRQIREAQLGGDNTALGEALALKERELGYVRASDATVVVSSYEVNYLTDEIGPFPHVILPLVYEPFERTVGFDERASVAFVGSFRHPPNVDAVRFLCEDIWPMALEAGLDADLHIIGSYAPPDLTDILPPRARLVGFVDDLEGYLERMRLTVAPLRYGAGVKGKLGNSLRMGVPAVATPMATEGMGLVADEHVLVARDPREFALKIKMLHDSPDLWEGVSERGQRFAEERFGKSAARRKLDHLLRALLSRH